MKPPGSKVFKLYAMDKPYTDPKTGYKYTVECRDALNPKCEDCHDGFIFVAYGIKNGIFDVYKFPCKCSHVNGFIWEQLDRVGLYSGRPVAYQCKWEDMPAHVFIHPVHAGKRMKLIRQVIHGLTEDMRRIALEQEGLPF